MLLAGLFGPAAALAQSGDAGRCAQTGATPYQPALAEAGTAFERAAAARLGPAYPQMPAIGKGWPNPVSVSATIPCVILKSIGYVESNWHQATIATPRGASGPPLINAAGCAYGVGQIASGMQRPGDLDRDLQFRIANDYVTNIAYAAKILAEKWRATPAIGGNDPAVAEDWYYSVWAYNGFSWANNPNYPRYDPSRPAFDGNQSFTGYPYQEIVWGFAAHPPALTGSPLWPAVPLTLPDRRNFPTDSATAPAEIPEPLPTHPSICPAVSLTRTPAQITFFADPGSPAQASATVALRDPFGASFAWQAASSATWLSPASSSGSTLPADLTVSANPSGLGGATYHGTITITSPNGSFAPLSVTVDLAVGPVRRVFLPWTARATP